MHAFFHFYKGTMQAKMWVFPVAAVCERENLRESFSSLEENKAGMEGEKRGISLWNLRWIK